LNMKRLPYHSWKTLCCLGMATLLAGLVTGCEEANIAIDNILGRRAPVLSAAPQVSASQELVPAKKRMPGEAVSPAAPPAPVTPTEAAPSEAAPQQAPPTAGPAEAPKPVVDQGKKRPVGDQPPPGAPQQVAPPAVAKTDAAAQIAKGKRRAPGVLPAPPIAGPEEDKQPPFFAVRDPFKQPTEVLPTECPPSMPLCKFDRAQLKLVGVIQVADGTYKGMVEDPDGRGYFITAGMQIGGATVTQVTNKGITLHLHRSRTDVTMPLFREARETGEY
jgi:hypothetical protein